MTIRERYQNELAIVQNGIEKLEKDLQSSSSVSSANGGSFSASYVDLEKLYKREAELQTRITELYRVETGASEISMIIPVYCGG